MDDTPDWAKGDADPQSDVPDWAKEDSPGLAVGLEKAGRGLIQQAPGMAMGAMAGAAGGPVGMVAGAAAGAAGQFGVEMVSRAAALATHGVLSSLSEGNIAKAHGTAEQSMPPSLSQPILDLYDKMFPSAAPTNETQQKEEAGTAMLPFMAAGETPAGLTQAAVRATSLYVSGVVGATAQKSAEDWVEKNYPGHEWAKQLAGTTAQLVGMMATIGAGHTMEMASKDARPPSPQDAQKIIAANGQTPSDTMLDGTKITGLADAQTKLNEGTVAPASAVLDAGMKGTPGSENIIPHARSEAVIGEGEGGYMGTSTPTDEQQQQRLASTGRYAPLGPDISDVGHIARTIVAPETFGRYDRLSAQSDAIRQQISDLNDQRTADLDKQIQEIEAAKEGKHGKLQSLKDQRDELLSGGDTPEMAALRQRLQELDVQRRDMAPEVSTATRAAEAYRAMIRGKPLEEPPKAPTEEPASVHAPEDQQRQNIIDDFIKRAITGGTPTEVAHAAARLEAERYMTLAKLYPKYSAEDWYKRESANLVKGRERAQQARELAQKERGLLGRMYDKVTGNNPDLYQKDNGPIFYSQLEKSVGDLKQAKASADQWSGILDNLKGVKKEEIEWSGVKDWLKEQKEPVTNEQLRDYLKANNLQVREVIKQNPEASESGEAPRGWNEVPVTPAKYGSYTLPGGKNYRELLLTLPERTVVTHPEIKDTSGWTVERSGAGRDVGNISYEVFDKDGELVSAGAAYRSTSDEQIIKNTSQATVEKISPFRTSHFDEPNIVSHIRFDDRTGPNGEKILHIAEIQSDWHQKGRKKGYIANKLPENYTVEVDKKLGDFVVKDEEGRVVAADRTEELARAEAIRSLKLEAVPDAPFKTTWPELAFKRMLRYAAEKGYDKISWDTGEVQNARYDLSKHVDNLTLRDKGDGMWRITGYKGENKVLQHDDIPTNKLPDYIGKDATDKLMAKSNDAFDERELSGVDLKVGGEGMKGFYDKILPTIADKLGKKFGAKTAETDVQTTKPNEELPYKPGAPKWASPNGEFTKVHSLPITDEMRDSVLRGQPLFQGGARGSYNPTTNTIKQFSNSNFSTLLHEKGHEWTTQLFRLASEDDAPQSMKDDAKTLKDWAGYPEDESDTRSWRKANEKLARGFERYLMDGVAPNSRLAAVFEKFKQWLKAIYKSVEALRAPINGDVRDAFDRLFSDNPKRTVIAPDDEPGAAMARVHETDASQTPPEKAADVRDNMRGEIDQTAKMHDGGVYNALKASEGATGGQPAEAASPEPATTGQQPASVAPEEPAAVSAGGGGAGPEGGGLGAKPDGNPPGDVGPNTRLGKPESPLVDKAGNIRLDLLNTPEDVNKAIRETAGENNNFIPDRRGKMTNGQVLDLADALGVDPAFLDTRKIGQAFNAEQIVASVKLLVQAATKVRDAAASNDLDAYVEAKERLKMIQGHVSGMTAEAGRALQIFQALKKIEGYDQSKALADFVAKEDNGKDLFQLTREMEFSQKLRTAQQVSKFVQDSTKADFKHAMLEYYINSLISGPITHLRYSVGNALNAMWTPLVRIPAAATVGSIREALSGQPISDRVYLGEAGAQLRAFFNHETLMVACKEAKEAFESGNSPALPLERLPDSFHDGPKTSAITGYLQQFQPTRSFAGPLGTALTIPGKSVSAIHSFFKALRYEQNIQGLAYRTAIQEGLQEGTQDFARRVANITIRPDQATLEALDQKAQAGDKSAAQHLSLMEKATHDALKELYMAPTDYHSAMGALTRFTNKSVAAKIVVPFMKIGTQITRQAFIESTPIGAIDKEVRENALYKSGGASGDMQLGTIAAGTALMGAMSLATLMGNATGDGPTDPNQRRVWLTNHKPNSLTIGDISIPYQGLGQLGMLMRFSANMTETASHWHEEEGNKLALSFMEGAIKSVLDENFMRGLHDMLDALFHPEEYGAQYIKSFATNWLPYSVGMGQVARVVDPYYRDTTSTDSTNAIFKAAWAKIPFASESLSPRYDAFGNAIRNGAPLPEYKDDPVIQRMEALNIGIGRLGKSIRSVPLTDDQNSRFQMLAGQATWELLHQMGVGDPEFAQKPQYQQIQEIHSLVTQARENARSTIMMENPEILQKAIQLKNNDLSQEDDTNAVTR